MDKPKHKHNLTAYTTKEMISVILVFFVVLIASIRGTEIGYLWKAFWGSIAGFILGGIIGLFSIIGIMATFLFLIAMYRKLKKGKTPNER